MPMSAESPGVNELGRQSNVRGSSARFKGLYRGGTSPPSIVPSLVEPCPLTVPICLEKILAFVFVVLIFVHALQRGFGCIFAWVGVFAVGRASRKF